MVTTNKKTKPTLQKQNFRFGKWSIFRSGYMRYFHSTDNFLAKTPTKGYEMNPPNRVFSKKICSHKLCMMFYGASRVIFSNYVTPPLMSRVKIGEICHAHCHASLCGLNLSRTTLAVTGVFPKFSSG